MTGHTVERSPTRGFPCYPPLANNAGAAFGNRYASHFKHLKLQGLQPKTVDAGARATAHSCSAIKLDLYGYKFYVVHVLRKPWTMPGLIRPPKTSRLPEIVTVEQAQALFGATRILSYRVFFFTLYSLRLRLSEGLALRVADIGLTPQRLAASSTLAVPPTFSRTP